GSESAGIQIQITDTGIGIAKEHQEKVFEKFFRVDSSLTYEVSGVGVGLFIARKIIELHNGKIVLESEIEKGTTVLIQIPISESNEK
ncbi:MAG TPA: ATP-binding protein, partial [Leptospiraceae bacterium]|nr:ATP-binding protein [Leptospiraceae bacterium]